MKTENRQTGTQSQVALHLMVNQIAINSKPVAKHPDSPIVNEIPANLYVQADQHKLAATIACLLSAMVTHSCSPIRIRARSFGNVILMHLKGSSQLNNHVFEGQMTSLQQLAAYVGGTVQMTSTRNGMTTVALSFINRALAA